MLLPAHAAPRLRFKSTPDGGGEASSTDEAARSSSRIRENGAELLCRHCRALVTTRGEAIEVEGRHQHTFFNPSGLLFEIGCFALAPGCLVSGAPTSEFAWFKGTRWQYSSCSGCGAHLGWRFLTSGGGAFFGLISNRLIEEERSQER